MDLTNQQPPWRRLAITAAALIILAVLFSVIQTNGIIANLPKRDDLYYHWALAITWLLIGFWFVRYINRLFTKFASKQKNGAARAWVIGRRILSALGYLFVGIVTLHLLQVQISSILVGGALTGVIVGIAAQSTLSNLFAGLILFTVRPFTIGQTISFRSYYFSSVEYTGRVIDVNWYYTTLQDGDRHRVLPNSTVILSAITVHSKQETRSFDLTVPYRVASDTLVQDLQKATGQTITGEIKTFGPDHYILQIHVPAQCPLETVRRVLDQAFA
ncbi:mechanosensitive ion channel family protein [Sulfoacidibacillus thermotolerans]|uniref:Mechanosensitive ion channel MscS domain-containing protein n=1 Tax=Sulfoacidibacillus thermotolerans TaxID=1765684 RepID=A0A2U3DB94_SULT2|nr:mechanosensitive ion channel family protein [Sulfoacidibacillus thermotolerans]PWI58535.1 hypothetical protein BM613_03190 [Sulfoacidibacillus thermotolerans]